VRPIRSAAVPISRRGFLVGGASALVLAACSGDDDEDAAPSTTTSQVTTPSTTPPATPLASPPFGIGVASGEPNATSVVLWTRLLGAVGDHDVTWTVRQGDRIVATGLERATAEDAHTVHALATGLEPDSTYEYTFRAGEFTSPIGRTHTTPDGAGERLRFAFASCQDWRDGYYAAHEHLAVEDVDLVVWLGDYIYEGPSSDDGIRPHDGPACETLDQYRGRYAQYRVDPNLQAAHARAPWFVIWDDHEVQNNYTSAVDATRRGAAYKAWWEHMPTRLPKPTADALDINRTLEWGGLASFFALDGRQHRTGQPCGGGIVADCPERVESDGSMLGAEQEAWVADAMPASTSTWNVVANQTVMAPSPIDLGVTTLFNMDQWDGYPAAQRRMLEVLARTANPVVITGDIHASAVGDIHLDDEVVGVELIGTSISSTFPADLAPFFENAAVEAGALMADATHRGYVVCEVTPETFRADYRVVESTLVESSPVSTSSSWEITAGTPGVRPLA
jgi:alkaline phosphatase D